MNVLVLNAGSSSQKSCLYALASEPLPETPPLPLWEAQIDWTKQAHAAELTVATAHGATLTLPLEPASRVQGMHEMLQTLWDGPTQVIPDPSDIHLVGHRVVHGGADYQDSTWITPDAKAAIARLIPLAPAHNPANLEGIEAIEHVLGDAMPQVAVFDTAFHSRMPKAAAIYPGPYEWAQQGLRRYGFHGISHQYCSQRAAQILGQDARSLRMITCHLGNGCSLAAVQNGYSIDTTMGFTPLEGLMMGSRSGTVDPGLLIHLLRQEGYSADRLDQLLNQASGLKGISGISNDMRQIDAAIAQGNERAQLALDLFIHRLRSCMGAMLASLGGLDVLVFTAGVGEHHPPTRALACQAFEFLGLKLDRERNQQSPRDADIATADSAVRVLIIHTEEAWAIAQECWKLAKSRGIR